MPLLGTIAAIFAGLLLVLPTVRVAQGRLTPRHASGLWISGAGFLLLALAALLLAGAAARSAAVFGAVLAVTGNMVQRRATRL